MINLFLRGFLSQAVNPKAVIFYPALFPQFLTRVATSSRKARCSR